MTRLSWVQLASYPTLVGADLARAKLELAGIPATVFDGEMGNLGSYNLAIGGIRLMVQATDLEAARALLPAELSLDEITIPEDEDITGTSVYCSRCHSRNLERTEIPIPEGLSGFARLLRSWFSRKTRVRCLGCGNTWKE